MGLRKGQTNNPNGRPKGVPNKVTGSLRERIQSLIDDNWSTLQRDLKKLDPKDRLTLISGLLVYVVPKLAATTSEVSIKNKLESMSNEKLELLVNQILEEDE